MTLLEQIGILLSVPIWCLLMSGAWGQSYRVHQGGQTPSRGHAAVWMNNAQIGDAGGALNGNITNLGITPLVTNPLPPFCVNSAGVSAPAGYDQLCISADNFDTGGLLTYAPYSSAPGRNPPSMTIQSGGPLAFSSLSKNIQLTDLPATVAGDVPLCVNAATGQIYMASAVAKTFLLTDDAGIFLLTDDSGSTLLTATLPAGSCFQQ